MENNDPVFENENPEEDRYEEGTDIHIGPGQEQHLPQNSQKEFLEKRWIK